MNKGDVIYFQWLDADNQSGWQAHDEESDNSEVLMPACGLFVSKGPKFITISVSYNQDADEWLGKTRIPVNWIVGEIEILKRCSNE